MKLLFIANGGLGQDLGDEFFNSFDLIVCVDGGLNELSDNYGHIRPTFIIGDLDSARSDLLEKYGPTATVVKKDNQDESDLVFSLRYFLENRNVTIDEITIAGAVGRRIDHSLCNILTLRQIPRGIQSRMLTARGEELFLVREKLTLGGVEGKTLSLIPLTEVHGLSCSGTRWPLNDVNLPFGFVNGISNVADRETVVIILTEGELLVVLNQTIQ
ncbi:MAG: thiamine diphosphokinase [Rickettsiales bacterium]|nr:thiamine diphosphokinase [Rickettsiales bacterium]